MRYIITLSYIGAGYCGWQIQNNAITVQGEIEKALSTLLGEKIDIVGAGRTDTGVNAIGYVAHFDSENAGLAAVPPEIPHLIYKLNAILGKGIVIHDIRRCKDDFHARFDARKRTYNYLVHTCKDPFLDNISFWHPYDLDIEAMNKAASYLIGEKDFSSFEKTGGANATSICSLYEAYWEYYTPQHMAMSGIGAGCHDYLKFTISANRFLRNMVRAVVGSLLEVGKGRKSPEWIPELIESRNRCIAGQSVPGKALFLTDIVYDREQD